MAGSVIRLPITNALALGDYTAQIGLGSEGAVANVLLDTGSSTLAVQAGAYDPSADSSLVATPLAQDVLYGTGGWTGPVVKTRLAMGEGGAAVEIDSYLALADAQERGNFTGYDGILGLAYNVLNSAYNLSHYLGEQGHKPAVTYPWPFKVGNSKAALQQFLTWLSRKPSEDLPPYFTALAAANVEKDKFAFYTLRSYPSARQKDLSKDPLNNGYFIIGGGEEQTDLYDGTFVSIDVVDDQYFNVNLQAVQVGNDDPVAVKPLAAADAKSMGSNAIVDSGTNALLVAPDVYEAIVNGFNRLNPTFGRQLQQGQEGVGLDAGDVDLASWPDITFSFQPETGTTPTKLSCAPSTYWQVDSPERGRAAFVIANIGSVQSILGLPLLNNYYTIFDRTQDAYGAIRFAPIRRP